MSYLKWKHLDEIYDDELEEKNRQLSEAKKKKKKGFGWFQTFPDPEGSRKFFNHVMGADDANEEVEAEGTSAGGGEAIAEELLYGLYLNDNEKPMEVGSKKEMSALKKQLEQISPEDSYHKPNKYVVRKIGNTSWESLEESKKKRYDVCYIDNYSDTTAHEEVSADSEDDAIDSMLKKDYVYRVVQCDLIIDQESEEHTPKCDKCGGLLLDDGTCPKCDRHYDGESLEEEFERISKEDEEWLDSRIAEHGYKVVSKRDYGWGEVQDKVHYQIISNEGNKTEKDFEEDIEWIDSLLDNFEDLTGSPCTYNMGLQEDGFISCGFDCRGIYYKPGEDTFHKAAGSKLRFKNGEPADAATKAELDSIGKHLGMKDGELNSFLPLDKPKKEGLKESYKIKLADGSFFKSEILPDDDLTFDSEEEANDFVNKNYNRIEFKDGYEIVLNEVWTNGSGPGHYENIDYIKRDLEEAEIKFIENSFDGVTYIEVSEEDGQRADEIICNWVGENYDRNQGKGELGDNSYEFIIADKFLYDESLKENKKEDFNKDMDFLAKDEEEAIDGYDKVIAKTEDEHVKDQLDKIRTEEEAHKAYLQNVKKDKSIDYTEPLDESLKLHPDFKVSLDTQEEWSDFVEALTEEGIDFEDFADPDSDGPYFIELHGEGDVGTFLNRIKSIIKDLGIKTECLQEDIDIKVNKEEIKINDGKEDIALIPTPKSEEDLKEDIDGLNPKIFYKCSINNEYFASIYPEKIKEKNPSQKNIWVLEWKDNGNIEDCENGRQYYLNNVIGDREALDEYISRKQQEKITILESLKKDIEIRPGSTTIVQKYKEFDSKQEAENFIISEEGYGEMSIRYIPKTKKYRVVWEEIDESINEDIEKHDTLNPNLFDGEELKPEIKEKIQEIVSTFVQELAEDNVKFNVKDIILVGSNVSYNYTKDSDLDVHIIADSNSLECSPEITDKLYSAYRSIFNKNYDINLKGIPVEIYVELDEPKTISNGVYSLNNGWIRKPEQKAIPEIDREAFEAEFKKWEDRYNQLISSEALSESKEDVVELAYSGLDITVQHQTSPETYDSRIGGMGGWSPAESDEEEISVDYTLEVPKSYVEEVLYNELIDEDDFKDMPEKELENYISVTFDELVEEFDEFLHQYFEDWAKEKAEEDYYKE